VAEPVVIVRENSEQLIAEIIERWSGETDLSLLGMAIPDQVHDTDYAEQIDTLMARMGSVLLVRSAQGEGILEVG